MVQQAKTGDCSEEWVGGRRPQLRAGWRLRRVGRPGHTVALFASGRGGAQGVQCVHVLEPWRASCGGVDCIKPSWKLVTRAALSRDISPKVKYIYSHGPRWHPTVPFVFHGQVPSHQHIRGVIDQVKMRSVVYCIFDMLTTGSLAVCPHASLCTKWVSSPTPSLLTCTS